ncbi:pentatricopeptide repeat-containing protein At1g03540-like [Phragmites australis]|uniref:pentatricopeptide repeat-containing protein At1g03540-like n=1 Tax=Phragmites australis TaxID=29695 RepID=UPI002D775BC2|nr:pentatricopeptide repeat-containing protein At1g03540-like [Phragmites australis]
MVAGTDDVSPSAHELSAAAKACAVLRDLRAGACIHGSVVVRGYGDDGVVLSALVDMHSHVAAPGARKAFEEMRVPDGMRGCRDVVVESALVDLHTGMVEQGRNYFNSMGEEYGIAPGIEHYNCMVDLLRTLLMLVTLRYDILPYVYELPLQIDTG